MGIVKPIGMAAAQMFQQTKYLATQSQKGRINLQQFGINADQIRIQLFRRNPDGQHFDGVQLVVRKFAMYGLRGVGR